MTFDLIQVVSLIIYVGTIVAVYWKMQKHTGEKIVLHQEKIKNLENCVEKLDIDKVDVRLAVMETQVGEMKSSIEKLTTAMANLTREIASLRRDGVRRARKANG